MITLKLSTYSKREATILAQLLWNARYQLKDTKCLTNKNCENCDCRHLCIDLTQANMYAKEYKPTRK